VLEPPVSAVTSSNSVYPQTHAEPVRRSGAEHTGPFFTHLIRHYGQPFGFLGCILSTQNGIYLRYVTENKVQGRVRCLCTFKHRFNYYFSKYIYINVAY